MALLATDRATSDTSAEHIADHNQVHGKLNAVIDVVADFGADNTGAGDTTTAVQNALNAVNANKGGTVFFPMGRYVIASATPLALIPGTRIIGSGAGVSYVEGLTSRGTTLEFSNAAGGIYLDGGTGTTEQRGVVMEYLSLVDGTGTRGGASGSGTLLKIRNWNHITLSNCSFTDAAKAIEVDSIETAGDFAWNRFEQLIVKNCTYGIVPAGTDASATGLMGVLITGGNFQCDEVAIESWAAGQFRIVGAKFDGGKVGIRARNIGSVIVACQFEAQDEAGVELGADTTTPGNTGRGHQIIGGYCNPTGGLAPLAAGIRLLSSLDRPPAIIGMSFPINGTYIEIDDDSTVGYHRMGDMGVQRNVRTVTSAGSVTVFDDLLLCDATGGSFELELPDADTDRPSLRGKQLTFKKVNAANTVTLDPNSTQTVDGSATSPTLTTQWSWLSLVCDGANWVIEGQG